MPFIISKHMKRVFHHSSCFSTYMKTITVVDPRGMYICMCFACVWVWGNFNSLHLYPYFVRNPVLYINITFCHCEEEATTLICYHLWPASPTRPVMAFAFDLLDRCESLLLECPEWLCDFAQAELNLPWYEQLRLDHVSTNHTMWEVM